MKNVITPLAIPPELFASLQEAADNAAKGIRDPEAMRKARIEMDRIRTKIFEREGLLDIGVPAIRELRGEIPESLASPHSPA